MAGIIDKKQFTSPLRNRERFKRVMHFQSVDRVPHFEFGYWNETYDVWHQQGLPREIDTEKKMNRHFGFDRFELCPVNDWNWLCPPFEEQVLEEDDRHKIIIDKDGVKCKVKKDGTSSIPYILDFPLKTRDDWERIKEKLNPDDPRRFPANWKELLQSYKDRDFILGIHCGSLMGLIRDLMGFENIALAFYDMPDLMHEIFEYMCDFNIKIIEKLFKVIEFDYANGWEDIAFRNGPMISPAMFREFLFPRFKRIADVLKKNGVEVIFTDCDGDINPIVDQWIEAGFTCQFPLEVGSGTDPVKLREKFGRQVLLIGGVNKRKLIEGKKGIDEEMARLAPLVEDGGFIPHVDHRCPPDVTLENYEYYLEKKKEILGF
jgi:uroporphyrinogen-III decarboxylase